ncbi:hypothetical protein [Paraburkholderia sacchari]|uniref:hypothetical protein n=1 Tax=Paraburkholderia sacchari TaxID=159450 RepID=UPI0039A548D8
MRLMGVSDANGGTVAPGTAEELNGRTPTDPGASWLNTGLSNANGKPLIIQIMPEANPAVQAFIMENYNSATPGQVPNAYTYIPSPVGMDVRGTVANVAGGVSTAAGRFGAATAAAAAIPSPYSPGLTTASFTATVVGWLAGGVEQAARPNPRGYITDSLVDTGNFFVSDRLPMLAPALNETAERIKSSDWMQQIKK